MSNTVVEPSGIQAVVWHGGRHLAVESFPWPSLRPGEVLVAVDLAAVCGSDLHTVSGARPGPHPSILGHEAVGRVVALGDGCTRLRVGDRIVWGVTNSCGTCDRCVRGLSAKCRRLAKTGHEPLDSAWGPLSGSYATHIVLPPGVPTVVVPESVPDAAAAISACALATVVACLEPVGILADRTVTLWGAGMLGLCAAALCAQRGAARITVVEPAVERRRAALRFGATAAIPPTEKVDPCDVAVELSGATPAVAASLEALDVGGVCVWGGAVRPSPPVAVDPEILIRGRHTLVGVHNYEPRHLREAIDFLTGTQWPWADVMAPPVSLEELPDMLRSGPGVWLRTTVAPQADPSR